MINDSYCDRLIQIFDLNNSKREMMLKNVDKLMVIELLILGLKKGYWMWYCIEKFDGKRSIECDIVLELGRINLIFYFNEMKILYIA